MSDHIPDVTKMIGDTPRSNAAQWIADDGSGGIHSVVSLCEARKLERELNAANDRIKRLEEDLIDAKGQWAALIADVVLYEDRAERIKQLEKWIACLNPIAQHSGQSESREWHGVDIRWLYPSQVVYLGEAKP